MRKKKVKCQICRAKNRESRDAWGKTLCPDCIAEYRPMLKPYNVKEHIRGCLENEYRYSDTCMPRDILNYYQELLFGDPDASHGTDPETT